ncbi:hypothetical protein RIF29_22275 [Crotalaria pallida]|uniref:PI3K/PI4K catalytic domain-containing protein n=1 Tax=Crotalaria pallida TaxID=3830 RepID=A0AAN9I986_CROPI
MRLLRCGKSYLRPDIKQGNFTREEEDTIIQLHDKLGNSAYCVLISVLDQIQSFFLLIKGLGALALLGMLRKITLNQEHKCMLSFAPDYDHLPLIAKVEVLWLKSRTSEIWLERRTNYTRSLAVKSMVGYLLGLGDRHPSNLMLHRFSGKILHIDFGDCFEAETGRCMPLKIDVARNRNISKYLAI